MSDSDKPASSAKRGDNANNSSTEADMTLDQVLAHAQTMAMSVLEEANESVTPPARKSSNVVQSSTDESDIDARLDRVLKYYHGIAMARNKNGVTEAATSLAQGGQKRVHSSTEVDTTLTRARERIATLDRTLAQLLRRATLLHTPPSACTAYTRNEVLTNDQSSCPFLRLPPELRNTIYTYVVYSKYSLPQFEWDEEHDSPKLNLNCAQPCAPPNDLLRTCRSIHNDSKGIYVKAKTQFWSDATFALALAGGTARDPSNFFRYLEYLLEEQASHITRVNIDIHSSLPFTVHLRSGFDADDSVTVKAMVCNHQYLAPAPLSFVESVEAIEQVQGQLSYADVRDIHAHWGTSPGSAYMRLCMEHHPEPVTSRCGT